MTNDPTELRRLAHDLRNALSSIYGYAQLLEFSLAKPGLEKELKTAKVIIDCVKKMDTTITERVNVLETKD